MKPEELMTRRYNRRNLLRTTLGVGLGATAFSGLLAACGDDDEPEPESNAEATTAPSTDGTEVEGSDTESPDNEADSGDGEPRQGGVLIWGMGGDADALDPHTTSAWAAWRQATMMYESLECCSTCLGSSRIYDRDYSALLQPRWGRIAICPGSSPA